MNLNLDTTDPKLARGLVREELRPLKAIGGRGVHLELAKLVSSLRNQYMPPTGKFSTPAAVKMRKILYREATKRLPPLMSFKDKVHLNDEDAKHSDIQGFHYWFPAQHEVTDASEGVKEFVGDFVELRCMRISTNRRRLVIDDTFCSLLIGEHFLVRLLERGATRQKPLASLVPDLPQLLSSATMMAAAFIADRHGEYPQVLVPYKDGIILCKISLLVPGDPGVGRHFRFRVTADAKKTSSSDMPLDSFFMDRSTDGKGITSIYAATFIPKHQLSTEQIWSKMKLEELIKDEGDFFLEYSKLIYLPEAITEEMPKRIKLMFDKISKITSSNRWRIATAAAKLARD